MIVSTKKFLLTVVSVILIFIVIIAAIDKKRMNEYRSQTEIGNKSESTNGADQQSPYKTIERVEPISVDSAYEENTEIISDDTTLEEVFPGDEDYSWIREDMLIGSWSDNLGSGEGENVNIYEFYYDNAGDLRYYSYMVLDYTLDVLQKGDIVEFTYGKAYIGAEDLPIVVCVNDGTNNEDKIIFHSEEIDKGILIKDYDYGPQWEKISDDRISIKYCRNGKSYVDPDGNVLPEDRNIPSFYDMFPS